MTTLVSVKNVVKRYTRGKQKVEVLHRLNLDIEAGEFLALMGPSGSGKTTLLNLIGGLDRPDEGEIRRGRRAHRQAVEPRACEVARAERRLRVPVLQPDADAHGRAQCGAAAAAHESLARPPQAERAGGASSSSGSTDRATSQAFGAVGRSAAACGHRTRAGGGSEPAGVRRAHGRSRPADRGRDPRPHAHAQSQAGARPSSWSRTIRRPPSTPRGRCISTRGAGRRRNEDRGMKYFPLLWAGLWRKRTRTILTIAVGRRRVPALRPAAGGESVASKPAWAIPASTGCDTAR